jgi:trans-aconitate 2-methyltransferase
MPWNPDVYHKFQKERSAPFDDLLSLIKCRDGLRVIDLGCGTGELTRRLADALPKSDVLGIDSSLEMLARATTYSSRGLVFEHQSIETVTGQWDVVFSHAAIHWVDHHEALIPHLLSLVSPGGQLVVQIPSNHNHLTHILIRKLAAEEPFRTALNGWVRLSPVLSIEQYADILYVHGASDITVFEKVYPHVLDNADALADWTSGTVLVPYFERLPQDLHEPFMQTYRERLREHFTTTPVFYGFRRILFAATRTAAS